MIPYSQPQGKRFFRGFSSGGKCGYTDAVTKATGAMGGRRCITSHTKSGAARRSAKGAAAACPGRCGSSSRSSSSWRCCCWFWPVVAYALPPGLFQRGAGDGSGHCHGLPDSHVNILVLGVDADRGAGTALGHDDDPLRGLPLLKAHLHTARHDGGHRRLRPAARSTALTPTAARNWRCARSIRRFR